MNGPIVNNIKDIKLNNFLIHISELEKIKDYDHLCIIALNKYSILNHDVLESKKEWLVEFLELGILFISYFDFANYFKNENETYNSDLLLLDKSVLGYEIKIPRSDFENEIKFKFLFEKLFIDEKLLPDQYKKLFESNSDVPF